MDREVLSWGLYDLANTAFSALFVTFFFPFYVKNFLGGNEFQIGLVFGVSMLLVALFVPLLGAWSDALKRRVPFIFVFTLICCVATAFVFVKDLWLALTLGLVANFAYHAALTVYNALLPRLGPPERLGRISGVGVSLGYLGTLLSLGMAALILGFYGWENEFGVRLIFPAVALFYFIFSLFLFVGIREKGSHDVVRHLGRDVWNTMTNLRRHKGMVSYLLSMFMFVNAVTAVIVFLYLYGRDQIGLSIPAFMIIYSVFSLSAVVGSFYFGKIVDFIGAKRSLMITGFLWLAVIAILFFVSGLFTFVVAGVLGGIALGAVWTCSRPLLVSLSPRKDVGQFFGFSELASKFSGMLGPPIFGWLKVSSGYPAALLSLAIFFVLGLIFLQNVPTRSLS